MYQIFYFMTNFVIAELVENGLSLKGLAEG